MKTNYDAIVVGSGPNGFAAAIIMQQQGLSVLLIEAKETVGGGIRSAELTLPGFIHDVCASVFPLGQDSPVFQSMNLQRFGLEYLEPPFALAHPLDKGDAVALEKSIAATAAQFGKDRENYERIFSPLVASWPSLRSAFVGPLHASGFTTEKLKFASYAVTSGMGFAKKHFDTASARALFGGLAAHSMMPLDKATTSSIAVVLDIVAHVNGWPLPKGGAGQITNALARHFESLGGVIETNATVRSIADLPPARIVMLDVTPRQLLSIAGEQFSKLYKWQLRRYKYGPGIFKIDWALSQPAPFINEKCRNATTVHLGGTLEEICESEAMNSNGGHSLKPFVLFVQPTILDPSRVPDGKHVGWAYCHTPNGSTVDMTDAIESQVERFAPGFRDCIIGRNTMNASAVQLYNPNYVGGDINGGASIATQVFTRPAIRLSPYRTSAKGIYVCSSSTPPGGGVHGICGYYAARRALKDVMNIYLPPL